MTFDNLAYDYLDDIPWELNPTFNNSYDSESFLKAFKGVVDYVPTPDLKITFKEDVWDFNKYLTHSNDDSNRFIFVDLPAELNMYSKFFVIHGITKKRKFSTINLRYSDAKSVILNIIKNTNHKSLPTITTQDIILEISSRNVSSTTSHNLYESIYQFYKFLETTFKLKLPVSISEIKNLGIKEKKISKNTESKLPDIPNDYYTNIIDKITAEMRNTESDYESRATACLTVILSQTGLRLGDLLCLTINQLHSKHLSKIDKKTFYIVYKSKKPSKSSSNLIEFNIFSSDLCTEAFQTLIELRQSCEFADATNFLYILNSTGRSKNEFPIPRHRFNKEYKRLFMKLLPLESSMEWDGIAATHYNYWDSNKKKEQKNTLYIPDTRQYRVHVCTELYNKGVPLTYIQKYMGHLSEYMMGYYVRPKDTYQENIEYSEKVIREMVSDDVTPLGDSNGTEIKKNIEEFIEKNKFNVKTDIKEIMEALGDKVIIRGKTGGVCIKTSLMPCSKDARTNEMMCAYNLCPNLFHFYYMIDDSYLTFKTLQETYKGNISNCQLRAAQKELNKIKDICRRRLIPELNELSKVIVKNGESATIERHPSLTEIIKMREQIEKEINEWMSKN